MIRVASAAFCDTPFANHLRISECTSCACSVVATLPVPMALVIETQWKFEKTRLDNVSKQSLPNRLVGNDDLRPVLDTACDCFELLSDYRDGLVCFSLLWSASASAFYLSARVRLGSYLQAFSTAQDDSESFVEGDLRLAGDELLCKRQYLFPTSWCRFVVQFHPLSLIHLSGPRSFNHIVMLLLLRANMDSPHHSPSRWFSSHYDPRLSTRFHYQSTGLH